MTVAPVVPRSVGRPPAGATWPRFDRFLVLLAAMGVTAFLIADSNPWNYVVLADVVRPVGLILGAAGIVAIGLRRWGEGALSFVAGIFELLPFAVGIAAQVVLALAAVVAGLFVAVVIVFGAAMNGPERRVVPARDAASDVYVEAELSGCSSFHPDGPVSLRADRGLTSRRVLLPDVSACTDYTYEFVPDAEALIITYRACSTQRIAYDPHSLTIRSREVTDSWTPGCDELARSAVDTE